jgi:hypothetical protein
MAFIWGCQEENKRTEMDALRRSARICKIEGKTNEYIRENGRARYNIE